MTQQELYDKALATLRRRVTSWETFYEFIDERVKGFNETQHPIAALDALYTMYAFLTAMREMPEEGDILVLTERMAYIIAFESKTKLGAAALAVNTQETSLLDIVSRVLGAVERQENQEVSETPQETGRVLH